MKEMTKQDLNRVSAMILSGVEWDENYQPKFAVDYFVDCESGDAVKVIWLGDYEFSLWRPTEYDRDLFTILHEGSISLVKDEDTKLWDVGVMRHVGYGQYEFDEVKIDVLDKDLSVEILKVYIKSEMEIKRLSNNQK